MMPASNQGLGMNMGFPDVCMTPAAPAPLPIPYPNIGMNATAMPFCPNIFVSFVPGHNMGAKPLMTNGDNAGVAHPLVMQPGGTTMGNPKILLTGLPAEHMLVPTYGNNFNNPLGSKIVPSVTNVLLCSLSATAPVGERTSWDPASLETTARELHDLPAPSLGLTTAPHSGGLRVVHVRRDDLGDRAGVQPGDLLVSVGGQETEGRELPRPEPGRTLRLGLEREGAALTLEGRWDETPAVVSGEIAAPGVGVLVVRRFSLALAARLDAEVERLVRAGARALVLDLRGNPGGALQSALEAAGLFLRPGAPLVRLLRPGRPPELLRAEGSGRWQGLPLVALIDNQTASAAEVLAATLQDARRAPVVGEQSFGKGVAETPGGAWAVLTRADGRDLRHVGVETDRSASLADAVALAERNSR
jgi:C-terminal peptidase prc